MARVENNEKSSAECRPTQTKTASSHSFSIQDILGLDKTQEKPDLYSSENNYFSSPESVIKIEPGSPNTTHLGILYSFYNFCINFILHGGQIQVKNTYVPKQLHKYTVQCVRFKTCLLKVDAFIQHLALR